MAFLGLFKKKAKKTEDSSAPKLEPISKLEDPIELPTPPQIPKTGTIPSDLPPINAPDFNLISTPHKTIPPINLPETPQMSKPTPYITTPRFGEGVVFPSNIKSSSLNPKESTKIKSIETHHQIKKNIIKSIKKEEEELPKFIDVIHKERGMDHEVKIPAPPHYLASMGESRKVAMEEGLISKSLRKPIFVEVNDYRKVIEELQSIKKDTKKSKELMRSLDEFRIKNSTKIKKWERDLEKVQRDLIFTDKILFEESGGS